jgi:hypothetical protein
VRRLRALAAVLAVGVLAGVGTWLVARSLHYQARADLCVAVGVAVALCAGLTRLVQPPPEPGVPLPEPTPTGDGLLLLTGLESSLSWGAADADRFRDRVRPMLVRLADDRLRTRHGIDPDTDPDHARAILGEQLWQLRTASPTRSPSRAELTALVAALESI